MKGKITVANVVKKHEKILHANTFIYFLIFFQENLKKKIHCWSKKNFEIQYDENKKQT